MKAFWREQPISDSERELLDRLFEAHAQSVFRENCSTVAFCNAALGSGNFINAMIAALACSGGPHAPIKDAYDCISLPDEVWVSHAYPIPEYKTPGWGSSFVKGEPDPVFASVEDAVTFISPELGSKIDAITEMLHKQGKRVFPNAACWTAATAVVLGIPKELSPMLFVMGRTEAWGKLYLENVMKGKS
jgi:hypothetical protein